MKLFGRENYLRKIRGFYHDTGMIKVITVVRRCGKTCLMHTIAEELSANGIPEENITFLDLKKKRNRLRNEQASKKNFSTKRAVYNEKTTDRKYSS
ncbi:MAG: AAA family ATPase [Eubacteriales bacterium]|nr:AAA family ATPase [Eubacteriales bacterium]